MHYVLVMMLVIYPLAPSAPQSVPHYQIERIATSEFDTKEACEHAGTTHQSMVFNTILQTTGTLIDAPTHYFYECVPKD
jgi:hypothetical protein